MKLFVFYAWPAKSDMPLCHLWTVIWINSTWIGIFTFKIFLRKRTCSFHQNSDWRNNIKNSDVVADDIVQLLRDCSFQFTDVIMAPQSRSRCLFRVSLHGICIVFIDFVYLFTSGHNGGLNVELKVELNLIKYWIKTKFVLKFKGIF